MPGFTGSDCDEVDYCFGVNYSGNRECDNEHFSTNNYDVIVDTKENYVNRLTAHFLDNTIGPPIAVV